MPFKTEQEAIEWVSKNIPFAVKSARKNAKYMFTSPFSSGHASTQVINCLGKELFKVITNKQ